MNHSGEEGRWHRRVRGIIEEDVFPRPSSVDLFNFYVDCNLEVESAGASKVRRENLLMYLGRVGRSPEVVVVAEAPGPWGCRFSGVPITSESQLEDVAFPIQGRRTSMGADPLSEYSAGIFWRVMAPFFPRFLVWNAVPFHPHRLGNPLTIRTPRVRELREFGGVTARIVAEAGPREVVALGRKAEAQLGWSGIACRYVRHPSQGGARAFEEGMRAVFEA